MFASLKESFSKFVLPFGNYGWIDDRWDMEIWNNILFLMLAKLEPANKHNYLGFKVFVWY